MEWEYLHGVLIDQPWQQRVLRLIVAGPKGEHSPRVTISQLGLERWELVTVVAFEGELQAFFKRQKLHPIGVAE